MVQPYNEFHSRWSFLNYYGLRGLRFLYFFTSIWVSMIFFLNQCVILHDFVTVQNSFQVNEPFNICAQLFLNKYSYHPLVCLCFTCGVIYKACHDRYLFEVLSILYYNISLGSYTVVLF